VAFFDRKKFSNNFPTAKNLIDCRNVAIFFLYFSPVYVDAMFATVYCLYW